MRYFGAQLTFCLCARVDYDPGGGQRHRRVHDGLLRALHEVQRPGPAPRGRVVRGTSEGVTVESMTNTC